MMTVLLVLHLLLALGLVGIVLIQRSEGGLGSLGGGGGNFMTGRGAANFLTRATAILAALFMATSIFLSYLSSGGTQTRSIVDEFPQGQSLPQPPAPTAPSTPNVPVQ